MKVKILYLIVTSQVLTIQIQTDVKGNAEKHRPQLCNVGLQSVSAQLSRIIFQCCPQHQSIFVLLYHETNMPVK